MAKTRPQSIFEIVRSTFELTRESAIQSLPLFVMGSSGIIMVLVFGIWVESRPGNIATQVAVLKNHEVSLLVKVLLYVVFALLNISIWVRLDRTRKSNYITIVDSLKWGIQRFIPVVIATLLCGGGLWLSELIVGKGGVVGKGVGWVLGFAVVVFGLPYVSAVILDGKGPLNALCDNLRLFRSLWWHVAGAFLYVLVIFSVMAVLAVLLGILLLGSLGQFWGFLLLLLGLAYLLFMLVMVGAAVSILVYHDLKKRKELLGSPLHSNIRCGEASES